jgi:hypothetical protein
VRHIPASGIVAAAGSTSPIATFAKKNAGALAAKEAASWAHRKAAEENTSVSRLVGSMLERQMLQEDGYTEARQQWSKLKPMNLDAAHRLSREDANAR